MLRKLLLLAIGLIFFSNLSNGQGTMGKDFWVAYLEPDTGVFPVRPPISTVKIWEDDSLELYLTSPYAAKVTIEAKKDSVLVGGGIKADYSQTIILKPNKTVYIKLPYPLATHYYFSDEVTRNGVHVYADTLISVQAVTRFQGSKGATSIIPSSSIPYNPEYFITTNASYDNRWDYFGHKSQSTQFAIVGIADLSEIEIIATGLPLNRRYYKKGDAFVIKLKKGETFGFASTDLDLTGSIIRSKSAGSKFAVFAGNRQTYSEQLNSSGILCKSANDHTYEQLFPTVTLGSNYTALPFKNNKGGYFLKVVAVENFTRVTMNGNYYKTLKQGEFFVWNVNKDTATRIVADKRISVMQFSLGNGCNQHPAPKTNFGGVAQLQLVPDHQFSTDANVSRLMKDWWGSSSSLLAHENYMNVVVKKADTAQFRINNKAVPNTLWKSGNTLNGYAYAQLDIDTGNYHLASSKSFMAYVYGYGPGQSFAYQASANFKPVYNDFYMSGQCVFDTTTFTALKNDSFSNYSWKISGISTSFSGTMAKFRFKDTGWHNVVMYSKQVLTNAIDSVTKNIHIRAAKSWKDMLINDTIVCGYLDMSLYPKNYFYDNIYTWSTGHPVYYFNTKLPGQFWEKVVERNGCVYIDTLNIENYEFPKPSFTSSDTVFCSNSIKPITFINTSTSKDSLAMVNWDFGDQNINDTNKIVKHAYKKAGSFLVVLRLRTIHTCEAIAVQSVDIKKAPQPNFTIKSADSCFSSNLINFTNTTVIDSALHMRYKWYFSDSFVMSNNDFPGPYTYKHAGKQFAELIYENWNGCIDTLKKDVIIYQAPKPVFTFQSAFNCSKDSIHITNKTTSNYKPLKNLWTFGDGKSDTAYSPVHYFAKKGTYTIKLINTIPQGCKDSTSATLKIFGSPDAKFTINKDVQCIGDNHFKFINTSTTDTGNLPIRKWSYSDGTFDQNTDTALKTFSSAGFKTVKLKVTGIFGCSDSITKTVEVKSSPVPEFSPNQYSQCWNSQNFVFTYVPQGGNDSIKNYAWYFAGDSVKNVTKVSNVKFFTYGEYPIKLKLTSKYGCIGEKIKKVYLNPNPKALFQVPKPVQCLQGNAFTPVQYSTLNIGTLKDYTWDYGDNTTANGAKPAAKTYTASGNYRMLLTVFSDSGCTDTTSQSIQVRPNAVIVIDPVVQACLGDSVALNGSATITGAVITNYQWDYGDQTSSDTLPKAAVKHLYKAIGMYDLKLTTTSDKGCKDTKTAPNWINVNALPNAAFNYVIVDGQNNSSLVTYTDLTQPKAIKRLWDFSIYGTSTKIDTTLSIIDTTTIRARLYITDNKGCTGMIEKDVFVAPPGNMYFPNAFTVNGDGINEGFGPVGISFATNYKFEIYNRWGELVFKSEKLGEMWDGHYDGKLCPIGNYIYKLQLNDFFGHFKDYKGNVLMMW